MKSIINKQTKEIYQKYVRIAAQTDITDEDKTHRKQRVKLIAYLADVYEREQKNTSCLQEIFPDFEHYQHISFPYKKGHQFDTKNEVAAVCFSYFRNIFYNVEEEKMKRIHAHVCMNIMRNMLCIYEMKMELHEEDIEDMFIKYDGYFRPVFPEELKELFKK